MTFAVKLRDLCLVNLGIQSVTGFLKTCDEEIISILMLQFDVGRYKLSFSSLIFILFLVFLVNSCQLYHVIVLTIFLGYIFQQKLRECIKPYFLRRLKNDVFNEDADPNNPKLSKKNEMIVWLRLTSCQVCSAMFSPSFQFS